MKGDNTAQKQYQFLHMSDLHVRDSTSIELLLEGYKQLSSKIHPDLLFVTGDFRHRVQKDCTFDNALDFLNRIVDLFKIKKEAVFLVPGNHDVGDFYYKKEFVFYTRKHDTYKDTYRKYKDELIGSFAEYGRFVNAFYQHTTVAGSRLEQPAEVQYHQWKNALNIIMLNTALISDGDNDSFEIADINNLGKLNIKNNLPSIVLAHHPIARLIQSHQAAVQTFMEKYSVQAYLCGDQHQIGNVNIPRASNPNSTTPVFICGKSVVEDGDNYSDVGVILYTWKSSGKVTVQPYEWKTVANQCPKLVESNAFNLEAHKKRTFSMAFPKDQPLYSSQSIPSAPTQPIHTQAPEKPKVEREDDAVMSLEEQSNLFEIGGKTIKFIPIICSWNKGEDEYVPGDITVTVKDIQYQMPEDIIENYEKRIAAKPSAPLITHNTYETKVRLDSYSVGLMGGNRNHIINLDFSKVYYRDYLIQKAMMDECFDNGETLRQRYFSHRDSLISESLTNICGVGIFIITSDNKLLISKASMNVAVNPGRVIYTASGSMDWKGTETNPFLDVIRESFEEIGYEPDIEHLRLFSIGIDYETGYYQFSFYEKSNRTATEIIKNSKGARDYHAELQWLKAIPFNYKDVLQSILDEKWDETAKANLITLIAKFNSRQIVERFLDPVGTKKTDRAALLREWERRADRNGRLAVLSNRYPPLQIQAISENYFQKVTSFIDDDLSNKTVLEVGGGIGLFTKYFAECAHSVTCVDVSPKMLLRNKKFVGEVLCKKVTYVNEFFQDFMPDKQYDLLVCSLVLIHNIDELDDFVAKMKQCSKTIYLFEHVEDGAQGSKFTHPKTKEEYINMFPEYDVVKSDSHMLCTDLVACIKLIRRD